jgi:ketosteroid isomerase-like protein
MNPDSDDAARRARNQGAARRMLAAISAADPEGLLAHLADDVCYEAPYYPNLAVVRGRDAMAAMLDAVRARFSSIRYEVVELIPAVDPDLVIAEVRGDHQVAGSIARYRNHYVMFIRFREGKVVHWREFSNPDVYRRATGE